jgi:hypothetical protein
MNILGNGGDFRWGGTNVIEVAGQGAVNFQPGSRTWLYEGFGLEGPGGSVANADVTLASGSVLRLPVQAAYNPATVPYVKANAVEVSGLVALDDRPLPAIGIAEGDVVLRLEDSGSVARNAALGSGFLTPDYEVYRLPYELDWGDGVTAHANNVILKTLGTPVYNPPSGGSDATTGPGALVADPPPVAELSRTHLRDYFWIREKKNPGRQLWIDASFTSTRLRNGSRLGLSYRLDTPAVLAGADLYANEDALFGIALGASWPTYWGDHTRIDANERLLMLYGARSLPHDFELSGDLALSRSRYQHARKIEGEKYSASYRGHNLLAGLELARPVELGNAWELRPFLSQDYIRQTVKSYEEKESGKHALTVEGQRRDLWITRLGAGINWRGEEQDNGWRFSGGGQAYWQKRSGDLVADTQVRFHNAPCSDPSQDASCPSRVTHPSKSERLPSNALGLGAKARWDYRDRMNVRLGYDLRVSRRETTHEGSVRVEWNW